MNKWNLKKQRIGMERGIVNVALRKKEAIFLVMRNILLIHQVQSFVITKIVLFNFFNGCEINKGRYFFREVGKLHLMRNSFWGNVRHEETVQFGKNAEHTAQGGNPARPLDMRAS